MLPYAAAAILLAVALILFGLATKHRTLLDPGVQQEMQARLDRLTPDAVGAWGRLSVTRMLRHIAGGLEMATGDLEIPPRHSPLRVFPIKQLIVFILPFPKNAPTAPALITNEEIDFAAERARVRDLIAAFPKRELARWPEHPAFGPLDREQWGVMAWKHLDHHFRQFGV